MNLRELLNFEITGTPERWKPREFEGDALERVRLEAERWSSWTTASFCFAAAAMYIPITVAGTWMLLDFMGPSWPTLTWLTIQTIAIVWSPVLVYSLGPALFGRVLDRFGHRFRPRRTRLVEPPPFGGWLLYTVGWIMTALWLVPLLLVMIVERAVIEPIAELSFLLEMTVLAWAGVLVARGLSLRRGDDVRCRRCSYPVQSGTLEGPGVCTECGRDLSRPHAMMIGCRAFRPLSFAVGVAIIAAATALRLA
jgi:hypothetical protein